MSKEDCIFDLTMSKEDGKFDQTMSKEDGESLTKTIGNRHFFFDMSTSPSFFDMSNSTCTSIYGNWATVQRPYSSDISLKHYEVVNFSMFYTLILKSYLNSFTKTKVIILDQYIPIVLTKYDW